MKPLAQNISEFSTPTSSSVKESGIRGKFLNEGRANFL